MQIEKLIAAILPSLCVSIIMLIFNRGQSKRDEKTRMRDTQRRNSEQVQLSLMLASAKLSYAVAMAYKRGEPNGEIEEGVNQYNEAMNEFKKFERNLVVEKSTAQIE